MNATKGLWVVQTERGILCECDSEATAKRAALDYQAEGIRCWVHYCD